MDTTESLTYRQYTLADVTEILRRLLGNKQIAEEVSEHTLSKIQEAYELLATSTVYLQCIVALLENDISEEAFHIQLKDQLEALQPKLEVNITDSNI